MSEAKHSYRQILRATSIIGGASWITILIGLVRIKALAMLLGPAGVGLVGLYNNLMNTTSALAGCGLGSSGVRQIAEAGGEEYILAAVRRTLWYANIILGLLGLLLLWLLREPISQWVFGDTTHSAAIGWLGLGALLSLMATSQSALLQGLRRIGDMARVRVIGSLISSAAAILFIYFLGTGGILWFVLVAPLASVLVAWRYAARLPRPTQTVDWPAMTRQAKLMFGLGLVFMAAGVMQSVTLLMVRSLIIQELGIEVTGYFDAAWAISMTYIGFVLAAMGADYYPRLTAAIKDQAAANRMVNQQAQIALLLAGPVLIGMLTFAPIVIHLLYASAFMPAADILHWQILGDIFKVASWPMGFILLARGQGRLFFLTQMGWNGVFLAGVWLGLPRFGVAATGVSFLVGYVIIFMVNYLIVSRINGFRWDAHNIGILIALVTAGVSLQILSHFSLTWTFIMGGLAAFIVALFSLYRLGKIAGVGGRIGRLGGRVDSFLKTRGIANG